MIVNPDVDGYTKTKNNLNIFWKNKKTQPTENKRIKIMNMN